MKNLKTKIELKNKIDIKKRFKFDLKKKLGLVGFICLIILVIFYFLSTSYQTGKSSSTIIQATFLKDSYKSKHQLMLNLQVASKKTDEMEVELNKINAEMLPTTPVSSVMDTISQIGREENLSFIYFKPKNRENFPNYQIQPIEVSMTGQYQDIIDFLQKLANLKRVTVLEEFVLMRKGTEGNEVIFNAQIDIFNPPIIAPEPKNPTKAAGAKK